jgi:hypothetical protein
VLLSCVAYSALFVACQLSRKQPHIKHCGVAERSGAKGTGIISLAAAQMREADKNRRGKKQRGGFADDQEDAGDSIAKSYKKRRY